MELLRTCGALHQWWESEGRQQCVQAENGCPFASDFVKVSLLWPTPAQDQLEIN